MFTWSCCIVRSLSSSCPWRKTTCLRRSVNSSATLTVPLIGLVLVSVVPSSFRLLKRPFWNGAIQKWCVSKKSIVLRHRVSINGVPKTHHHSSVEWVESFSLLNTKQPIQQLIINLKKKKHFSNHEHRKLNKQNVPSSNRSLLTWNDKTKWWTKKKMQKQNVC